MKAYTASRYVPGYGPRIFVPYEHITGAVKEALDKLSCWGGADKDTGLSAGWEFPPNHKDDIALYGDMTKRFQLAKDWLTSHGFMVEEVSEANHEEVWGM